MIEKQAAYRVGEKVFSTLREAQCAALTQVLHGLDDGQNTATAEVAAAIVVNNAEEVKQILGIRTRKSRAAVPSKPSRARKPLAISSGATASPSRSTPQPD